MSRGDNIANLVTIALGIFVTITPIILFGSAF